MRRRERDKKRESAAVFHGELETEVGRTGGWASEPEGKGGREAGAGLVSSCSQSEAGVALCRVNLTLATQWREREREREGETRWTGEQMAD